MLAEENDPGLQAEVIKSALARDVATRLWQCGIYGIIDGEARCRQSGLADHAERLTPEHHHRTKTSPLVTAEMADKFQDIGPGVQSPTQTKIRLRWVTDYPLHALSVTPI